MRKDILAAILTGILLVGFSIPNLSAEANTVRGASLLNSPAPTYANALYSTTLVKDLKELNKKNKFVVGNAGYAKYGVDILSASESFGVKNLSLRAGVNKLSKNATPGIQLVVTW